MIRTLFSLAVASALLPLSPFIQAQEPDKSADANTIASKPFFQESDLFTGGEGGVHTYRIPALAATSSGALLAVADARQDDHTDLPGNIDIVMRRSIDNGRTWGPVTTIQDLPEGHGAGDPSLLVERESGRVFCFYAYGPPGIGWNTAQPGSSNATDTNTLHAHYIHSDDDGLTWHRSADEDWALSTWTDLNPSLKDSAWRALFAASGHGIQTRAGRLIQPYAVKDGGGSVTSRNAYSDDGGETWRMGNIAGAGNNESKAVELNNGGAGKTLIMQNMRSNTFTNRIISISHDGGINFGPQSPDSTLIDPRVNASITRYASTELGDSENIIAFSNPASTSGRENMTVRLSYDEGQTWPVSRVVWPGPSGYSSLIRLPDGKLGLLYEKGDADYREKIVFARFNLAWVSGN